MAKKLSGYREVEFPEDTEPAGKNGGKDQGKTPRSKAEQKKLDKKNEKRQVVKDIVFLLMFLIFAFTAVILINRNHSNRNEAPGTDENDTAVRQTENASGSTDGSVSETADETETNTERSTEPATEIPTEAVTEAPTEPATIPPTEPPVTTPPTAPNGEAPRLYPYQALQPGLTMPVQGGITMPSWITQDLLRPGADSRPGTGIGTIRHVVIHYVGNVGSSAKDNRDYFEGNVDGRKVSSHFIVGMYGEIIQCIPINEVAYAQGVNQTYVSQGMVNHNYDSISIENCHPYTNGQFTSETYWALVKLSAWLLEQYGLGPDALMRHYDATTNTAIGVHGKGCPLYFVEHPEAWEQFKATVGRYMQENPNIQ